MSTKIPYCRERLAKIVEAFYDLVDPPREVIDAIKTIEECLPLMIRKPHKENVPGMHKFTPAKKAELEVLWHKHGMEWQYTEYAAALFDGKVACLGSVAKFCKNMIRKKAA